MRHLASPDSGRLAIGLAIGLALMLAGIQPALAHARLATADPAPNAVVATSPAALSLHFASALAKDGNSVDLYHSDGKAIKDLTPQVIAGTSPELRVPLPSLTPDVYTVGWTSVSGADGHHLSQFYSFTVGDVSPAVPGPALGPLTVGDTRVALQIERGNVGPNAIAATVRTANGQPVTNLQRVIFRYRSSAINLGEDEIFAPATGSTAKTPVFTLGLAGDWQLNVTVRRVGQDDVSATTRFMLAGAPSVSPTPEASAAATSTPGSAPTSTVVASTPLPTNPPAMTKTATLPEATAAPRAPAPTPTAIAVASSANVAGPSGSSILIGVGVVVLALLAIGGLALRRRS